MPQKRQHYARPALRPYGSLTRLAQGMSGVGIDGSSGMIGMSMGMGIL
ncbi:MAG TPA: hypothetical protein VK948_01285 [Aeromicrobium sp.]|nr:hypothetical protein [Aeromicrobium sp.]